MGQFRIKACVMAGGSPHLNSGQIEGGGFLFGDFFILTKLKSSFQTSRVSGHFVKTKRLF